MCEERLLLAAASSTNRSSQLLNIAAVSASSEAFQMDPTYPRQFYGYIWSIPIKARTTEVIVGLCISFIGSSHFSETSMVISLSAVRCMMLMSDQHHHASVAAPIQRAISSPCIIIRQFLNGVQYQILGNMEELKWDFDRWRPMRTDARMFSNSVSVARLLIPTKFLYPINIIQDAIFFLLNTHHCPLDHWLSFGVGVAIDSSLGS